MGNYAGGEAGSPRGEFANGERGDWPPSNNDRFALDCANGFLAGASRPKHGVYFPSRRPPRSSPRIPGSGSRPGRSP